MIEVEFNFSGTKTVIQCKSNEKIKSIWLSFANKIQIDLNNLYFSYDGKAGIQFNEKLTIEEIINEEDKKS